jgi:hypothetical protein
MRGRRSEHAKIDEKGERREKRGEGTDVEERNDKELPWL